MAKAPIEVFFVYRQSSKQLGSTLMRCFQLCQIAHAHIGPDFVFRTRPIMNLRHPYFNRAWVDLQPKDAIFIFTKDAVSRLDQDALMRLQQKSRAICVDYIDRNMAQVSRLGVDLHIASSMAQLDYLTENANGPRIPTAQVPLLLHHADLRLHKLDITDVPMPKIAYFGAPNNCYLSERIASRVPIFDVGLADGMERFFRSLPEFNLHYAVRPEGPKNPNKSVFKPFTKGATAAVCRAPIIVNRTADDAEYFLGQDYPFFVADLSEREVLSMIDYAEDSFGDAIWNDALDRILYLGARTHPKRVAADLAAILNGLT